MGAYWFRLYNETYTAHRGSLVGLVKNSGQNINAKDNTDALLAEATYIINNVDEFLVEEEYALAA
jgi:hypothetical protein